MKCDLEGLKYFYWNPISQQFELHKQYLYTLMSCQVNIFARQMTKDIEVEYNEIKKEDYPASLEVKTPIPFLWRVKKAMAIFITSTDKFSDFYPKKTLQD